MQPIINELHNQKPGEETELAEVIKKAEARIHRRGLVVIFSDLFGDVDQLMKSFARLRAANHEIIVFQIFDPDELDFPFRQWTQFARLEQTSKRHLVDPAQVRRSYLDKLESFREQLASGCNRHRINLVPMTTEQPFADTLASYLALRRRKQ